MLNNSQSFSKKFLIGAIGFTMAVSLSSCSKNKNSAEPAPSDSASVSASADVSVSASASPTKTRKPTKKPSATPKATLTQQAPAPIKPTAKKPYTQTVAPKPPIKLDTKEQVFAKEFTKQLNLTPKTWDAKVDEDPLTYKLYYVEMLSYAKGALCSYIATGLDDFTLGSYISNEISYQTDVQTALLAATRKAYGCKGK